MIMNRLRRMSLREKTFLYVGTGLMAIMGLLSVLSLQTVNQGIELVYRARLALVENIAVDIDEV